jgi:hypothetical protein
MGIQPANPIDGGPLFADLCRLWIEPEVSRRQSIGEIPSGPFDLRKAQVLLHVDRPAVVRLNEEVRGRLLARLRPDLDRAAGDLVLEDDVEDVTEFQLDEEDDRDCAHFTAIRYADSWFVAFDTRYNGGFARDHMLAAHEFLSLAAFGLDSNKVRAVLENLFATVELCTKARLMLLPMPEFRDAKKHRRIRAQIQRFGRLNEPESNFAKLLDDLEVARAASRFLRAPMTYSLLDAEKLFDEAAEMYEHVRTLLPERVGATLPAPARTSATKA